MAGLEKRLIGLVVTAAIFGGLAVLPVEASTFRESRRAKKNYEKSDYQAAADTYQKALEKSPESDVLNFGMGTTLYKQEKYPEAIQHLEKSLLSPSPDLQSMGHYNLGNALYRDGIQKENSNLEQAVQQLERSLEHYTSALKHDDKDKDAQYNYDFVKKELERLKEKLQKQQQQKKDQSQQKQDQKKDQDQGQNQDQQEKPSSGSQNKPQDQQQSQQQQPSGAGDQEKKDQQEQKPQQSPEDSSGNDQQKQEGGSSGEKQPDEIDKPAPGTESTSSQTGKIPQGQLSPSEAKGLLENYQNNEEPKGLLNFMKNKGPESPVLNDW